MPPKPKITREMIIDAAWDIVRTSGENNLNTRNIADRLGCSTQPVLYAFHTMEEIRERVYRKADEYHSEYLMQMNASDPNPSVSIWKNYIRFSVEEKHLFRFLSFLFLSLSRSSDFHLRSQEYRTVFADPCIVHMTVRIDFFCFTDAAEAGTDPAGHPLFQ